jgi:hypothetical protein
MQPFCTLPQFSLYLRGTFTPVPRRWLEKGWITVFPWLPESCNKPPFSALPYFSVWHTGTSGWAWRVDPRSLGLGSETPLLLQLTIFQLHSRAKVIRVQWKLYLESFKVGATSGMNFHFILFVITFLTVMGIELRALSHSARPFWFSYFWDRVLIYAKPGPQSSYLCIPTELGWQAHTTTHPAIGWDGGLTNFLPGLASNWSSRLPPPKYRLFCFVFLIYIILFWIIIH